MAIVSRAITDAWQARSGWVQSTLPTLITKVSFPATVEVQAENFGACSVLDILNGIDPVIYQSAGPATITLSSLQVSLLKNTALSAATVASENHTAQLPLSFATMDLVGAYSYSQPCSSGGDDETAKDKGNFTQTLTGGTLAFNAGTESSLDITGIATTGSLTTQYTTTTYSRDQENLTFPNLFEADEIASAIAGVLTMS